MTLKNAREVWAAARTPLLTSLAAGGILLAVPVALGNTYGFNDTEIQEDSPAWSCVDDGNRICGPNNPEGQPAGCYDEGGVLVAHWPCHVVRLDPKNHPDAWDVEADPGSPDYDEGQTYDDPMMIDLGVDNRWTLV